MKIICGDRSLDLERMNAVKPDGAHVWAGVMPYTYHPELLPDSDDGTYFMTSDRGAVAIRDMAFKVLIDMAAWSGSRSCMYLLREIARSAADIEDGWDLKPVPLKTAMSDLHGELGLRAVHMPASNKLLRSNLRAFYGPCDLDQSVGGMLSDYIYTDGMTFVELHDALSELLMSFGHGDFVMFMEGVYGALSQDPDEIRKRMAASRDVSPSDEAGGESPPKPDPTVALEPTQESADQEPVQEATPEPEMQPEPDSAEKKPLTPEHVVGPDEKSPASGMSVRDMPRFMPLPGGSGLFSSGRKLKGADLTGTDETYTLDYYAQFYKEAMEQADSDGFADRLIRARAGDGVAPIAILEEAVTKLRSALDAQGSGRAKAVGLKSQLMELAGSISEAAGKLEDLEDIPPAPTAPAPEPAQKAPLTPAPAPAPEPAPAPASSPEPAVETPAPAAPEPAPSAQGNASDESAGDIAEPSFDEFDEYDEYGDIGSDGDDGPPEDPDDGAPDEL